MSPKSDADSPSSKNSTGKGCKQRSKARRPSRGADSYDEEDEEEEDDEDAASEITNSDLFRHRLYSYLFRNLNRALDELYYLCETESCPEHCEETARVLEASRQDFIKV
jgi:hypothetical protein